MASTTYYLSGKIDWFKSQKPDTKYGEFYTLDLTLDEESYGLFKESKAQLKERPVEDGIMIKLRRPASKKVNGELQDMGPPTVLLKNADGTFSPFTGNVGNGSVGTCKVRVYDTDKGKGHELILVAIDELVPYEGEVTVGGEDYPF